LALDSQEITLEGELHLRLRQVIDRRGNDIAEEHIVDVFQRDTEDPSGGIEDEFAIFEGDLLDLHQGSGFDITVVAIYIQRILCVGRRSGKQSQEEKCKELFHNNREIWNNGAKVQKILDTRKKKWYFLVKSQKYFP
jgi:hypothetical protein